MSAVVAMEPSMHSMQMEGRDDRGPDRGDDDIAAVTFVVWFCCLLMLPVFICLFVLPILRYSSHIVFWGPKLLLFRVFSVFVVKRGAKEVYVRFSTMLSPK